MTAEPRLRTETPLHERDFVEWLDAQAEILRSGRLHALDAANLAEELRDMGVSERNEVLSRLDVLVLHLLKRCFSSEDAPRRGWDVTVQEQRRRIARRLESSPSVRLVAESGLVGAYPSARDDALRFARYEQGGEPPSTCPWTLDQMLDPEFWPGPPTAGA